MNNISIRPEMSAANCSTPYGVIAVRAKYPVLILPYDARSMMEDVSMKISDRVRFDM